MNTPLPLLARAFDVSRTSRAAGWYLVLTLIVTWPLAAHLRRDIPGDLGDPLFVGWAIARAADHWLMLLSGDVGAVARFWQAGIFHPEPLATAFSEHFVLHALQILPLWAMTRDIILCYNLLFLSSYVIGATGTYLLARELTGSPRAAFVAGALFAFTPYRAGNMAHLQVLSSQWMPFALYGLRRYFATGRRLALAGGGLGVFLQNLSSGYYLIYFGPFVGLYALTELWTRGLIARWRVWRDLIVAALTILVCTLPFALPYTILQRRFQYRRSLEEISGYSADLLSWLTASPDVWLWGWLQTWPRNEGALFPGLTLVALALAGLAATWPRQGIGRARPDQQRAIVVFALAASVLAMWMALGPRPLAAGQALPIPGLYELFYHYVPGFDVSRVPSRYTAVLVLMLAIAAAHGAAWLDRSGRRLALAGLLIAGVVEGGAWPLPRNRVFRTSDDVQPPSAQVHAERDAPLIYRTLATLPPDAVLAHLPFGYAEHELRYMFYSSADGYHRMVNGYSGAFPGSYVARSSVAQRLLSDPAAAIESLRRAGVTHVVVHADLWPGDTGARTVQVLEAAGLTPQARVGQSFVLAMGR